MNLYSNKSCFTAPELLESKFSYVSEPSKEADIYSFGLILFSLFSEQAEFFSKFTLKDLIQNVKKENKRPKIRENDANVPTEIATLIR